MATYRKFYPHPLFTECKGYLLLCLSIKINTIKNEPYTVDNITDDVFDTLFAMILTLDKLMRKQNSKHKKR